MKILVVDDDHALRQALHRLLTKEGHEVELAFTGESALRSYMLAPADLVLLDINLGPGLTGQEVALRLPRSAHVVIITGYSPTEVREKGKKIQDALSGTMAILGKPVDSTELLQIIERVKGIL